MREARQCHWLQCHCNRCHCIVSISRHKLALLNHFSDNNRNLGNWTVTKNLFLAFSLRNSCLYRNFPWRTATHSTYRLTILCDRTVSFFHRCIFPPIWTVRDHQTVTYVHPLFWIYPNSSPPPKKHLYFAFATWHQIKVMEARMIILHVRAVHTLFDSSWNGVEE